MYFRGANTIKAVLKQLGNPPHYSTRPDFSVGRDGFTKQVGEWRYFNLPDLRGTLYVEFQRRKYKLNGQPPKIRGEVVYIEEQNDEYIIAVVAVPKELFLEDNPNLKVILS